jgi:hypothetical protein
VATAIVNGVEFDSDAPCVVHHVTWNGSTFSAGSYLLAALFALQDWLDRRHPGLYVYVIQGAWNTGVELSAGTHDKDGVVDVAIVSRRTGRRVWLRGQRWLRINHFYAWWRHAGSWFSASLWHFHMIVVGITSAGCSVGYLIPGQISDAQQGRSGLVGHVLDPTWRPKRYTPFPYARWVSDKEDEMSSPKDWTDADWKAFRENAGWDAPMNITGDGDKAFAGKTFRWAMKQVARVTGAVK